MRAVRVRRGFPDMPRIRRLMDDAFPSNERMPMSMLLGARAAEFLAFYEGDAFCGFVSLLTYQDITHILYLAIEPEFRDRGLGTEALRQVRDGHPGQRIIADLEAADDASPNAAQRGMRRRFYEKNGFSRTGVGYRWRGETYEIFSSGGDLTDAEFWEFWDNVE